MFWELLDEILNAVLFVLIGMEVLLVVFSADLWIAGTIAVVVTLAARLLTVGLPVGLFWRWFRLPGGSWKVLTWGGLRGGISVALALSLPAGGARHRGRADLLRRRVLDPGAGSVHRLRHTQGAGSGPRTVGRREAGDEAMTGACRTFAIQRSKPAELRWLYEHCCGDEGTMVNRPAFACTIGIDYSGAETPTASLKGLRVYLAEGDVLRWRFRRRRARADTGLARGSRNGWWSWQKWWGKQDSNLRRHSQRTYSPLSRSECCSTLQRDLHPDQIPASLGGQPESSVPYIFRTSIHIEYL